MARGLLALLDEPTRKEVIALLEYKEDEAGGLMNPRSRDCGPTPPSMSRSLICGRRPGMSKCITRMCWTRNNTCWACSRCVSSSRRSGQTRRGGHDDA